MRSHAAVRLSAFSSNDSPLPRRGAVGRCRRVKCQGFSVLVWARDGCHVDARPSRTPVSALRPL